MSLVMESCTASECLFQSSKNSFLLEAEKYLSWCQFRWELALDQVRMSSNIFFFIENICHFRTNRKLLDKQARLVSDNNIRKLCWSCGSDAECNLSQHLLPLHQRRHPYRPGPGHHLPAQTGLHHTILWQEETSGHGPGHLWFWNRNFHICATHWLVKIVFWTEIFFI